MKPSGEAKLLIILGIIVLLGGGALVGMNTIGNPIGNATPRPTPQPFNITAEQFDKLLKTTRHIEGDTSIPVTIVEFADFECPSCRRAYNKYLKQIIGRKMARVAFFHYPFPDMHPNAMPAAIGSEAAAKQGKFWEMYNALFDGEMVQLSPEYITDQAKKIGLDMKRYEADIKDAKLQGLVNGDHTLAEEYKVDMTPTFFIRDPKGKLHRAVGGEEFGRLVETVIH